MGNPVIEMVNVRVFRGPVVYNKTGQVTSENQTTKIARPSKEWNLFLKNAPIMYTQVEVVEVKQEKIVHGEKIVSGKTVPIQTHEYTTIETSSAIKAEIDGIFTKKTVVTTEQKQIAELTEKLNALLAGQSLVKKETLAGSEDDLEKTRAEYLELFGKKPHHKTGIESLRAEIDAKLAE